MTFKKFSGKIQRTCCQFLWYKVILMKIIHSELSGLFRVTGTMIIKIHFISDQQIHFLLIDGNFENQFINLRHSSSNVTHSVGSILSHSFRLLVKQKKQFEDVVLESDGHFSPFSYI